MASQGEASAPLDEAARLEALHRYRALDTPPEPGFDDITRVSPIALR